MKKKQLLLLIMVLGMAILTGCGGSPAPPNQPSVIYHNLLLVYPNTDYHGTQIFTGSMSNSLKTAVINAFKNMPNLVKDGTKNLVGFTYDIVEISTPVASLTPIGTNLLYLSQNNIQSDLQQYAPTGTYDSVHVIWYNGTINSYFGLGGTFINNGTTTYSSLIAGYDWWWTGLGEMYGEPILHEWLHGVTSFYQNQGFTMPVGDLHSAEPHGYTKSSTEGWMPWYRDYMRGKVWESQSNQYTGLSPIAWQCGTPNHPPQVKSFRSNAIGEVLSKDDFDPWMIMKPSE